MKHFTFILIPYEMTGVDLNNINANNIAEAPKDTIKKDTKSNFFQNSSF